MITYIYRYRYSNGTLDLGWVIKPFINMGVRRWVVTGKRYEIL